MRLRSGVATAALLAAVGGTATASAQHALDWRASVMLSGAYEQSVSDAPSATSQTFAGLGIAFVPSIVALLDTPRTESSLAYTFSLGVAVPVPSNAQGVPVSYAHHLNYAGHYAINEITSATLGAGFTISPLNTFDASADPTAAPIQAVPSGASYMIIANASEGIVRQLSPKTSFAQGASFTYGDPIAPGVVLAKTYAVQNGFTITHGFSKDTFGGTLGSSANIFTASQLDASAPVTPGNVAFVNTLTANYTHPFTESLSTALSAGISQTLTPGAATLVGWQPTGTALLAYNFSMATAALGYAHQTVPNLAAGTLNFADSVSLRFSLPIGVTGLAASGSAGYTRTQPLTTGPTSVAAANPLSTGNVIVGDVGLNYQPWQLEMLSFGIRGQIARQFTSGNISDATAALADDFTRYAISLNVTVSYPRANAAQVRPSFTPVYSVQPPTPAEITSTDRYFGDPVAGPAPEEPAPKPVKAP